ncbi:MAG: hypothetical protein D4S01_11570 [Dehalococcoidia bacterium]|nr:MAG: hypothetical protein D4S01_11570 [Dehalococcoidia bacterium]
MKDCGILGLGNIVDRLGIVNIKISLLEGVVKNKEKTDEQAGVAARFIRTLNKERNTLVAILNKYSGRGFEDIKVEDLGLLEK